MYAVAAEGTASEGTSLLTLQQRLEVAPATTSPPDAKEGGASRPAPMYTRPILPLTRPVRPFLHPLRPTPSRRPARLPPPHPLHPPSPLDELPPEMRPYSVRFAAGGALLAVGMEDGALLLFAREEGGARWSLKWRQRAHTKELKDSCFSADASRLCTVAPDGQCLAWSLSSAGALAEPPAVVAQPSFWWHNTFASQKRGRGGRKKSSAAQWRCVALGPAGGAAQQLFGALNHMGGPGWVARCELARHTVQGYVRVSSSPLTALALSADGALVSVGTSEGELVVLKVCRANAVPLGARMRLSVCRACCVCSSLLS